MTTCVILSISPIISVNRTNHNIFHMINWIHFKDKFNSPLSFLTAFMLLGTFLRFKRLTFQSFWLDELFTVNTVLPGLKTIIAATKNWEQIPPFHYILLWIWTNIFSSSEFSFRSLSALTGVGGIVAIYFLGKELFSKDVGLFASAILSMTTYHIYYSQEVRTYSLLCLLSILSYLFFIKQIKTPSIRYSILYVLSTVFLIYSHYYGLFLVASQVIFLFFIFPGLNNKKNFRKFQLPSFICLAILYIPWLPTLLKMSRIQKFWAVKPKTDFFVGYFRTYLGNESFLILLFSVLLIIFLVKKTQSSHFVQNKILLLTWVFIVLFIPYVRSFNNPAPLVDRYAIIILPAIILMVASAIEGFKEKTVQVFFVSVIMLMFGINLFYTDGNYYQKIKKEQWREATQYILNTDPENKYMIFGHSHFLYYINTIFNLDIKIQPISFLRSDQDTQKLYLRIKKDRYPGLWVLEGLDFLEDEHHNILGKKLIRHRSMPLLETRATLYVTPRNYTITNQKTRVPLGFLDSEGQAEEQNDYLIRIKSGNAIILPPLKFSAGSHILELEINGISETDRKQMLLVNSAGMEEKSILLDPAKNMFRLEFEYKKPTTSRIKIQFNNLSRRIDSTVTFTEISLHKQESLSDFLSSRQNELDKITLIISARDDAHYSLNEESRKALVKIGLEKIKDIKLGDSYLALLENGKVIFEDVGNKTITFRNAHMSLFSGGTFNGNKAQIYIDNIDYSYNNRGLNIAVKKGSLIDSYYVDTHGNLRNIVRQNNYIGKKD